MVEKLLHRMPSGVDISAAPTQMVNPYSVPPHSLAQAAAAETIHKVRAYMRANADSELHRQGKMFGVLVVRQTNGDLRYLQAFSAMLDGSYAHEGFVPPVYAMTAPPIGNTREESQRMQRLLFASYELTNGLGERRSLLDIFADEKHILTPEEWFGSKQLHSTSPLPPSGAGECCAPKLLQYALAHDLQPIALAEFWIGEPPRTELRREGAFYTPCSGKCVPILRHMLHGITIEPDSRSTEAEALCCHIETVYEDRWLMVVNKPAGLLSVPGKGDEVSLSSYLQSQTGCDFLQPVHRLDQDTSGLLVLAKTPDVYRTLQAYFQRRDILKRYEAVLAPIGEWTKGESGCISLPLLPNPFDRPRQMVDKTHGKPSITMYRIRALRHDGSIFIDFYPQTGRTHQLRVHAAHPEGLNAPIKGDRLYGTPAERLYLHAAEIRFVHPITQEEMHFCIPSHF